MRLLLALLAALVSTPARASVVLDLTLPEMIDKSSCIVHGTVEDVRAAWGPEKREIFTRVRLRVAEAWKCPAGVVAKRAVVVRQLGGTVEGVSMAVPGAPEFTQGEEVIVFLSPARGEAGAYVLVALGASKITVEPASGAQRRVTRNLEGLAFARAESGKPVRVAPPRPAAWPETLSDLLRALRAHAR
jgi:hypothetical protein